MLVSSAAQAQAPTDLINAGKPVSNLSKLGQRGAIASGTVTNTGAYTTSIDLELPPARAGLVPNLKVVYSSQAGASRIGYYGWSLTAGYIRRSQRLSAPETSESPIEYSVAGGSGELVSQGIDPGTGYKLYGDRLGTVRWRFLYNTAQEQWIVLLPNGRRYYLGDNTASNNHCVESNAQNTLAVRWNLCRVEDREKNEIRFDWSEENCENTPGGTLNKAGEGRARALMWKIKLW